MRKIFGNKKFLWVLGLLLILAIIVVPIIYFLPAPGRKQRSVGICPCPSASH